MTEAVYKARVAAKRPLIWQALVRRIEYPAETDAGIKRCTVSERIARGLIRRIECRTGARTERVTIDEAAGTVEFALLDHPDFTGNVMTRVKAPHPRDPDMRPILEFRLSWQKRRPAVAEPTQEISALRDALRKTREHAEAAEQARGRGARPASPPGLPPPPFQRRKH